MIAAHSIRVVHPWLLPKGLQHWAVGSFNGIIALESLSSMKVWEVLSENVMRILDASRITAFQTYAFSWVRYRVKYPIALKIFRAV